MKLKELLLIINQYQEIHFYFKDKKGELIFNSVDDIDDFWKNMIVTPNSLAAQGEQYIDLELQLPEMEDN